MRTHADDSKNHPRVGLSDRSEIPPDGTLGACAEYLQTQRLRRHGKIPMRIVEFARGSLAVAAASLAVLTLLYGDLAPLGQSVPAWITARNVWLYGPALLLLVASAGLCFGRTALPSLLTIGGCYAFWALTGLPAILAKPLSVGSWYGFCEALTAFAGAWVLYALLRWQRQDSKPPGASASAVRAGQVVFGLTCVFYGWSHFVYANYTASMVPTWLPDHLAFARFTGVGHLAAGLGIALGILPRLAAVLEALMMSLFGLLVWVPTFWANPRPKWATPPVTQWSELVVNVVLVASALVIVASLKRRPWSLASRPQTSTAIRSRT